MKRFQHTKQLHLLEEKTQNFFSNKLEIFTNMQRAGWDSRRRNKNIGTAKSGHGQANRMRIPESWASNRLFHEKLENPVVLELMIGLHKIIMMVEPVQKGFLHACTPDDIVYILNLIHSEHIALINLVVLRQPKRKEHLLNPVWGRLQYWSNIHQYSGGAIHLEAQSVDQILRWSKSLSPNDVQEIEQLRQDGHKIVMEKRYYAIHTSLESIRATQLYRTLPHEVGHYVDYIQSVKEPAGENIKEKRRLENLYWNKTSRDKEAFAHRYALDFSEQHRRTGHLPFDRLLDKVNLPTEGLEPSWFIP